MLVLVVTIDPVSEDMMCAWGAMNRNEQGTGGSIDV